MRVKSAIAEGKIKTVKQIREKYAVSKTVEADLLKLGITKD